MQHTYKNMVKNQNTIDPSTDLNNALHAFFKNYPISEWWRMFVDGCFYQNMIADEKRRKYDPSGWDKYEEREPGSLSACFNTWMICLVKLLEKKDPHVIDINFIHCLLKTICPKFNFVRFRKDYEKMSFDYGVDVKYRYTKKGCAEILREIETKSLPKAKLTLHEGGKVFNSETIPQYKNPVEEIYHATQENAIHYETGSAKQQLIENLITQEFKNYYEKISKANTDDEKLKIIGDTITFCERAHPFTDCNGRIFVNILLNYLLLANGFPPATFFDPNVFDAFGHVVKVLKTGINNTIKIYRGEMLFDFVQDESHKNKIKDLVIESCASFLHQTSAQFMGLLKEAKILSENLSSQQNKMNFTLFSSTTNLPTECQRAIKASKGEVQIINLLLNNKDINDYCAKNLQEPCGISSFVSGSFI